MFCPKCGQQQVSDQTRFCSQCGISINGLAEWIENSGNPAVRTENVSLATLTPRRRGIRRGGKMVFFSLASSPFLFLFSLLINTPAPLLLSLTFLLIGLTIMLYARLFSDNASNARVNSTDTSGLGTMFNSNHLPTASTNNLYSADARQIITSDLRQPPSVTDHTTKLLDKN